MAGRPPVSTERPRRGRGVAATRLGGMIHVATAASPRIVRDVSARRNFEANVPARARGALRQVVDEENDALDERLARHRRRHARVEAFQTLLVQHPPHHSQGAAVVLVSARREAPRIVRLDLHLDRVERIPVPDDSLAYGTSAAPDRVGTSAAPAPQRHHSDARIPNAANVSRNGLRLVPRPTPRERRGRAADGSRRRRGCHVVRGTDAQARACSRRGPARADSVAAATRIGSPEPTRNCSDASTVRRRLRAHRPRHDAGDCHLEGTDCGAGDDATPTPIEPPRQPAASDMAAGTASLADAWRGAAPPRRPATAACGARSAQAAPTTSHSGRIFVQPRECPARGHVAKGSRVPSTAGER